MLIEFGIQLVGLSAAVSELYVVVTLEVTPDSWWRERLCEIGFPAYC